jgi:hypothetical protein
LCPKNDIARSYNVGPEYNLQGLNMEQFPKMTTEIGRDTLGRFLVSGTAQLDDQSPVLERHGICATREKAEAWIKAYREGGDPEQFEMSP